MRAESGINAKPRRTKNEFVRFWLLPEEFTSVRNAIRARPTDGPYRQRISHQDDYDDDVRDKWRERLGPVIRSRAVLRGG